MMEILSFTPVWRGLIVLILGGFAFPITGIYVIRMNLLPLRFMLMHGVLLGGAVSLVLQLNPLFGSLAVNVLIAVFMASASRSLKIDLGWVSAFMMVLAMGLASILIYSYDVPAKDTMSLLWGSPFALTWSDLGFMGFFSVLLIAYHTVFYRQIKALFFDREIAFTVGVNEKVHYYALILIIAVTVAAAIRLVGALLMDALLLLPAIIASIQAKSLKSIFITASIWGGFFSAAGFFVSIALDFPVSGSISVLSAAVFIILYAMRRKK